MEKNNSVERRIYMCDTLVATGSATKSGCVIFAKNSDREPNEPQVMLRIPRRRYDLTLKPKLKTTYLEIDQVEETNEIVISKPAWMWGCEMGFNEYSVTIGNEAVFTKEPYGNPSLTGMDMIRLALERTKTAKDAADTIVLFLEQYGQGGNCGYTKKMQYHNAFIIADKNEAYVLETAGKYWVRKKVVDYYTISNGLTIENDFDDCHPDLISDSIAHRMCHGREDFNFKKLFSEPIHTTFSGCRDRRASSMDHLRKNKGDITSETMMEALESHQKGVFGSFDKGSMKDLCMHAGSVVSSQTTASIVGELKTASEYWYTGSSLPCISVFKPFVFHSDYELFGETDLESGVAYWAKREIIARMLLTSRLNMSEYQEARAAVQRRINEIYHQNNVTALSKEQTGMILRKCADEDNAFVDDMLKKGQTANTGKIKGNLYFKHYWAKQNAGFKDTI